MTVWGLTPSRNQLLMAKQQIPELPYCLVNSNEDQALCPFRPSESHVHSLSPSSQPLSIQLMWLAIEHVEVDSGSSAVYDRGLGYRQIIVMEFWFTDDGSVDSVREVSSCSPGVDTSSRFADRQAVGDLRVTPVEK